MTQDEIIDMARQAGFVVTHIGDPIGTNYAMIETFAKLVRNHYSYTHAHLWLTRIEGAVKAEREACAKVCEENATDLSEGDWDSACNNCADLIRARSNT